MAGSVPVLSGTQVVKVLERAGFSVVRVSGSHHVMRRTVGCTVVVPVHAVRDMPNGTLRNVLGRVWLRWRDRSGGLRDDPASVTRGVNAPVLLRQMEGEVLGPVSVRAHRT